MKNWHFGMFFTLNQNQKKKSKISREATIQKKSCSEPIHIDTFKDFVLRMSKQYNKLNPL